MTTNTEVHLAAYPQESVSPDHFTVVQTELPEPGPGQVLVRNELMTLAAAYRDQMRPFTNIPHSPDLAKGDLVEHYLGWREYAIGSLNGSSAAM
jgi:NADPH-dependent curcumin reductase CurA